MTDKSAEIMARLDSVESLLPDLSRRLLELQQGELGIERKSNDFDLVTQADSLSEAELVRHISDHFPNDQILAEEGGGSFPVGEAVQFLWILDPIDGTTNYANRLPIWAISIGLMFGGERVGGLVAAPGLSLSYRGVLGQGSTCNGRSITANQHASIGEGIIATGFPYDRAKRAAPICRALENMLHQAGGVRRLGAASLDFCFLADGRFAGYYEIGLKPWDYAAGSLIAEEAGAMLTDLKGDRLDIFKSAGVVGTNGRFHEELLRAAAPMMEAAAI